MRIVGPTTFSCVLTIAFSCLLGATLVAACGNTTSRPPQAGIYRLAEARLWLGERHAAILCDGNFSVETAVSGEQVQLAPKGSGFCEARTAPTFSLRWGGDCTLAPVTFLARSGRTYVASEPELSCSGDPVGSEISLEPHKQGFSLIARGERGIATEYFFERVP